MRISVKGLIVLMVILIPIYFNSNSSAFSIIIQNETGVSLRIDSFEDNCGNVLVEETNPVSLSPGQSLKFENVECTVHHYRMCANGTCEGSSLGMKLSEEQYLMIAWLKSKCLCVKQVPLIWPGVIRCKKERYYI